MAKEYKFTKQDLMREIQDVRELVYRNEREQREARQHFTTLIAVVSYAFVCGVLVGRKREQDNPTTDDTEE